MSRLETVPSAAPRTGDADMASRLAVPALLAVVVTALALGWVVRSSESAWHLLGVGRPLVPPEYYPASGFLVVFATSLGQAVGWAGASAVIYYVATLVGLPRGPGLSKAAMSLAYLGLAAMPLLAYHAVFGRPLLGLPAAGIEPWLLARHPDAHWLLYRAHPWIELSVVPQGVVFLGGLWLTGQAPRRSRILQTVLAMALVGTSLAVALALAIHSTLVHIRLLD